MIQKAEVIGDALEEVVRRMTGGKDVAVAFSGGLDSGAVAALAMKYAKSVSLYTVGTDTSYDIRMSEEVSEYLGADLNVIRLTEESLMKALCDMISVTGTTNPLKLSFEIPLFMVCGECREKYILTGQGADELFMGYSKYAGLGPEELRKRRDGDYSELRNFTMIHENKVADHFGKTLLYPFLDESFSEISNSLDFDLLVPSPDRERKQILMDAVLYLGYPLISSKKKKAAQYGSGMMDTVNKTARRKGMTYSQLVESIVAEMK